MRNMSCRTDLRCTFPLMSGSNMTVIVSIRASMIFFQLKINKEIKDNLLFYSFIYRLVINLMTINATSCLLLFPVIIYDMQMSALYSNSESLPIYNVIQKHRSNGEDDGQYVSDLGLPLNSNVNGYLLYKNHSGTNILFKFISNNIYIDIYKIYFSFLP